MAFPVRIGQVTYSELATPWSDSQVSLDAILGLPSVKQDRRSFQTFRHLVVPAISGLVDFDFWHEHVLRNVSARPAVQHAAIALGCVYEQHLVRRDGGIAAANAQVPPRVFDRYNTAIQSLGVCISKATLDAGFLEEAMIACLLFICIEMLQEQDISVLRHLEGGLDMLLNLTAPPASTFPAPQPPPKTLLSPVMQNIAQIFARLDSLAASYIGSRTTRPALQHMTGASPTNVPITHLNRILDARTSLDTLMISILDFITPPHGGDICFPGWTPHPNRGFDVYSVFHGTTYRGYVSERAEYRKRLYAQSLAAWEQAFQALASRDTAMTAQAIREYATLTLSHQTITIRLVTAFASTECLYDTLLPQFFKIVQQAEILAKLSTSPQQSPSSPHYRTVQIPSNPAININMSTLYPLYLTALKCRHRALRIRALNLLRTSAKEAVWDGAMLARIAEYVIDLEDPEALHESSLQSKGEGEDQGEDTKIAGLGITVFEGDGDGDFGVSETHRIRCLALNIEKAIRTVWLQCDRSVVAMDGDGDGNACGEVLKTILYW